MGSPFAGTTRGGEGAGADTGGHETRPYGGDGSQRPYDGRRSAGVAVAGVETYAYGVGEGRSTPDPSASFQDDTVGVVVTGGHETRPYGGDTGALRNLRSVAERNPDWRYNGHCPGWTQPD